MDFNSAVILVWIVGALAHFVWALGNIGNAEIPQMTRLIAIVGAVIFGATWPIWFFSKLAKGKLV